MNGSAWELKIGTERVEETEHNDLKAESEKIRYQQKKEISIRKIIPGYLRV